MAFAGGMWFDSWSDILRTLVVGVTAYAVLVLVVRIAGKRTLSQFNAFDFVVTVALGSVLATALLSSDVSLAEGAVAFVLLAALQFVVAFLESRVRWFRRAVSASPTVVLRDGQPDLDALRRHRLGLDVVRHAARSTGVGSFEKIACAVLETDGSISIITREQAGDESALPPR
jgi:uncharacterized membrane protein YcaP (DUF421 family)